jgi:hypothetical protein
VSPTRQLAQIWRLRVRYGVEPGLYYLMRLYDPARWPRRRGVVRQRELDRLVKHMVDTIAAADGGPTRATFDEKRSFAAWCAGHALPTVTTLVRVEDGRVVSGAADDLPAADLFSKVTNAFGGRGACRWWWMGVAGGGYRGPDGVVVDRTGVVAAAVAQSRSSGSPILVQRAIEPHPDVRGFTGGALATVRFFTLRSFDGVVQPLSATYRMPVGGMSIDAFNKGGLAAPVDLASGRLREAVAKKSVALGECVDHHPDTGALIPGATLPDWAATVALATRAHRLAPRAVPLFGWDVALTPEGPLLLEGNIPPAAGLAQIPAGVPLGETPLVACLLDFLRAIDRGW